MTSSDLIQLWQPTLDNLINKFKAIPDDAPGLDEPSWSGVFSGPEGDLTETGFSPRQLLVHLVVGACDVPQALATGSGFEAVKAASAALTGQPVSALTAALEGRRERHLEFLGGLSEEQLARRGPTPLGERSTAEVLTFTALHLAHHKGQLMHLMRTMGIRPGRFL